LRKLSTDPGEPLDALLREKVRGLAARTGVTLPRICVAYSGGLDSTVLLQLLASLMHENALCLTAVHVNHGLSVNADAWEAHCRAACETLAVEFKAFRVEVNRGPGESLEEQAREARYAAFAALPASAMALAHHAEDQAETLLLQMLRGAGPRGLAAMPEFTLTPSGQSIWRPLLEAPRTWIRQYAKDRGIAWIEDESNLDPGYKRNFVRHRIWPALTEGFPAPAVALARVARLQADAAHLLADLADIDMAGIDSPQGLDCAALKLLSASRQANLLRRWISRTGARAPSEARLAALQKAISDSTNDTRLTWVHENQRVIRRRNLLVIETV